MIRPLVLFARDESGAVLTEYAMVTAIVAMGAITAMTALGATVNVVFGGILTALQGFQNGAPP